MHSIHLFLFSYKILFPCNFLFSPCSFSQQLTPHHSVKLPSVTHVVLFQTACKIMSHRCFVAGQVSAKKQLYTTMFHFWAWVQLMLLSKVHTVSLTISLTNLFFSYSSISVMRGSPTSMIFLLLCSLVVLDVNIRVTLWQILLLSFFYVSGII